MFLASFPTGPLAANCYLAAADPAPGGMRECVIVDPGMESAATIAELVTEHRLSPVAVLVTHGHADHSADAAAVADRWGAPCLVGAADVGQLADPLSGLTAEIRTAFAAFFPPGVRYPLPARLADPAPGPVRLAGLDLTVLPAPGHTPGSTLYRCATGDPAVPTVVFTGDVVFAGSIGRTDLPGGDLAAMNRTLRDVVLALPDDAVLLPGHGPQTTVGRERATNPFLPGPAPR